MKKLIIFIAGILLISASLNAAAFEKNAKSRSAEVTISSEKPLATGNNTLDFAIRLKDNDSGIKEVEVKAFMPAMPGMPAMESKGKAVKKGDGLYQAAVDLSMSGTWQIHIVIVPNKGKKMRVKSSLNLN